MFTSGMSAGALAVLALFAGDAAASNFRRQVVNGTLTSSTAAPSPTGFSPGAGDRLTVGGRLWQYDGCLQSVSEFSSFTLASTSAANTVESCLAACPASRYAALYANSCYCANVIDEVSTLGDGVCDIPCPGNGLEACGGNVVFSKRQLSDAILLSLYEAVVGVAVVPVPTITGAIPIPTAGELTVITYINNYFDVCDCDAGLIEHTTTQTLTYAHCGCTSSTPPAPPMTTTTKLCNNCGPNGSPSTVTVTLPCTATTTGSAVYKNGACSGAGCPVIPTGCTTVTPVCHSGCPAAPTSPAVCTGVGCTKTVTTTVTVGGCPATVPASSPVASGKPVTCSGGNCNAPVVPVAPVSPVVCNGANCPGVATATAAVVTKPCPTCPGSAKYTGAASAHKVGGVLMAAGLAAALL